MKEGNYFKLSDIHSYVVSYNLSNYVWQRVVIWDFFAKKTIGTQFVRAIDSISSNIAEGFGRYTKKDKIKFYRYSLGSAKESMDWAQKCFVRGLLKKLDYDYIMSQLNLLPKEINHLIKFTNDKLSI